MKRCSVTSCFAMGELRQGEAPVCKHCVSFGDCSSYSHSLALSDSAGISISIGLAAQHLTQAAEPAGKPRSCLAVSPHWVALVERAWGLSSLDQRASFLSIACGALGTAAPALSCPAFICLKMDKNLKNWHYT